MISPLSDFSATLKSHRLSTTATRLSVFKALLGREPLSMHELIANCQASSDRSSVYRTIGLFERIGICQRLQFGWKYKIELSDQFQSHHHHMSCLRCGATIELAADTELEARLQALALAQHFLPQDHQIEIRGLCQKCQSATGVSTNI